MASALVFLRARLLSAWKFSVLFSSSFSLFACEVSTETWHQSIFVFLIDFVPEV